jgi:hypothetical protein
MGIIVAIIIMTGFDVSPDGIVQYAVVAIISAFAAAIPIPDFSILVAIVLGVLTIIQAIRTIRQILSYGTPGIIAGASGFLSGLIIMLFSKYSAAGYAFLILAGISILTSYVGDPQ